MRNAEFGMRNKQEWRTQFKLGIKNFGAAVRQLNFRSRSDCPVIAKPVRTIVR